MLELMCSSGLISRNGTLFHLPGHQAQLNREQREFQEKIQPLLKEAGNVPPRTRELVEMTGIPLKSMNRILKEACKSGSVIQVADNRHYLPETISELASFTETLANQGEDGAFTVIAFRDASGIGRNLCVEIMEYFDAKGFTRREGNSRLIRTQKRTFSAERQRSPGLYAQAVISADTLPATPALNLSLNLLEPWDKF